MNQEKKSPRFWLVLTLILLAAMLAGCGGVPINNYAGLSEEENTLFLANQNFLWSINAGSASVNWKYPEKGDQATIFYAPPVVDDGWLVAGSYQNVAYGFELANMSGSVANPAWVFNAMRDKGRMIGSPALDEGIAVLPSTDKNLYALNAKTGELLWKFPTREALWASPVILNGVVYQSGLDHSLYALELKTGKLIWEIDLGGPALSTPVADPQGVLFATTLNKEVLAIEVSDGSVVWRDKLAGNVWNAGLLVEGKLYLCNDANQLVIRETTDGKEINRITLNGKITASPVLAGESIVVVTEGGEVVAFSKDGQTREWSGTLKGKLYSTPVVAGEKIVVAPFQGDHILTGFDLLGRPDTKWDSFTGK